MSLPHLLSPDLIILSLSDAPVRGLFQAFPWLLTFSVMEDNLQNILYSFWVIKLDYGQIKTIVEEAINNSTRFNWLLYLLIFLISAGGAFLGAYLKKKGENAAIKQDLAVMTNIVQNIQSKYDEQIEYLKASLQLSNQLKLAAMDKRLQKHQEAYTLWRKLFFSIHDKGSNWEAVKACQDWWEENCLYLSEEARQGFRAAINLAFDFKSIPREETKERREWFNEIKMAGDKILEGVKLPPLGEDEIKLLKDEASLSQPKTQKPG